MSSSVLTPRSKAAGVRRPLLGSNPTQPRHTSQTDLRRSLLGDARALVPAGLENWEFPGWGHQAIVDGDQAMEMQPEKTHEVSLGQFRATAICGNDITSSCLYVAGLCSVSAGILAPVCLLIVAGLLYLFRSIYGEVVTALPVNGGAYNVLLNTTSKAVASLAACLTLLSYVATCVVSGNDACIYAQTLWAALDVNLATILLLLFFALLVVWGISDSANVALIMFIAHIATLTVLVVFGCIYAAKDKGDMFVQNWHQDFPDIRADGELVARGSAGTALFFGVAAALLGISGFETSANFVEEQAPGVFVKTLRNMWFAVAFFNPVLSLLALFVLPLEGQDGIYNHTGDLLAQMAHTAAGKWLKVWVAIDATVVLSGAVLTSFVGVTGLVRRMAMDRCLPQFLLNVNSCRKTNHWIVLGFFLVASSLFLILRGNVETLAGVYNLAFLSVMSLFAIGCLMLKWKRPRIPRAVRASYVGIVVALILVTLGLLGNVLRNPKVVQYFVLYFGGTTLVVFLMFQRVRIMRILLYMSRWMLHRVMRLHGRVNAAITKKVLNIHSQSIVFFAKSSELSLLNKAVLYVKANEQTQRLIMVHVAKDVNDVDRKLRENVYLLDSIYPKLRIDFLLVKGEFGPLIIRWLARELQVGTNMMFISCPDEKFQHKFSALGGVRVITNEHPRVQPPMPVMRSLSTTTDSSVDGNASPQRRNPLSLNGDVRSGAGAGAGAGSGQPTTPGPRTSKGIGLVKRRQGGASASELAGGVERPYYDDDNDDDDNDDNHKDDDGGGGDGGDGEADDAAGEGAATAEARSGASPVEVPVAAHAEQGLPETLAHDPSAHDFALRSTKVD